MAKSKLEKRFIKIWEENYPHGPMPIREHRFAPPRRYRFDFAFIDKRIGIDLQGAVWIRGGHSTGTGINNDCNKNNLAVLNGWKFFKFTVNHLRDTPKESLALVYSALTSPLP